MTGFPDRSQRAAVGSQFAGRVGLFLRVDDFDTSYRRMLDHGVEFLSEPRDEPYGRFAVFVDVAGNKWDLLGPPLKVTTIFGYADLANARQYQSL